MKQNLLRPIGLYGAMCLILLTGCSKHGGKVVDAQSNQPIPNATVFHNGAITQSDSEGRFVLSKFSAKQPVMVKLPGYRRAKVPAERFTDSNVRLEPFQSKGVYLSFGALKTDSTREGVLAMLNGTDLNTLVVDVKNERGYISMDCDAGAELKIARAAPPAVDDMEAFIKELHARNIYMIGRVVTFRDDALGQGRPDLAVQEEESGKPWQDGAKMKWADAFRSEAQDYNIAVAVSAAAAGFDEILFDSVTIPGGGKKQKLSMENNAANRAAMRKEFWEKAHRALAPYNVYLSVEFGGSSLYGKDQNATVELLRDLAGQVDYLTPTLFPADLGNMLTHRGKKAIASLPYRAVAESIKGGAQIIGSGKQLRPWLQNYESRQLKMSFTERQVALQMQAAVDAGASGFLLWNAASKYTNTAEALKLFASGPVRPDMGQTLVEAESPAAGLTNEPVAQKARLDPVTNTAQAELNTNHVEVAHP
jgi:hypothetical protein